MHQLDSQELDRIRGRGQQGARAPVLWDEGQVANLLQGSPVVKEVQQRLQVTNCGTLPFPRHILLDPDLLLPPWSPSVWAGFEKQSRPSHCIPANRSIVRL